MTKSDSSTPEPVPDRWHQTRTLPGGVTVGRHGALSYVLDEDGNPISRGYHEVYVTDDGITGEIGARRESIESTSEGD